MSKYNNYTNRRFNITCFTHKGKITTQRHNNKTLYFFLQIISAFQFFFDRLSFLKLVDFDVFFKGAFVSTIVLSTPTML
jgi:hypothetical protein